jgi:EAL domain-containing protein (putative c-di-GMP-specific phosphodiesterase class I)
MPFSSLYNSLASRLGEPQGKIESIHITETPKDSKWNSAMKALNKKVASGELEPRLEMAVDMNKMELKRVELKTPLRELSRLNSKDKTPIDPILSSGLFLKIENHELKHARALSERLKVEVAVNVAPVSIVDKDLLERKIKNLQHSELFARLVLEISERYLMNFEPRELQSAVRRLKRHGVRVGLDEVGRGFSSFQLLHEVEFSHMKISPELYRDELGRNRGWGLVKHIVSMANSLGIVLSATGVSSQEDCLALLDMGVALQQGSYVSKLLFGTDKVKLSELPVLFKDGFTDYLNL